MRVDGLAGVVHVPACAYNDGDHIWSSVGRVRCVVCGLMGGRSPARPVTGKSGRFKGRNQRQRAVLDLVVRDGGWFCFYCTTPLDAETATVDHAHPLSMGGAHKLSNWRLACTFCNRTKGGHLTEFEYRASIALRERQKSVAKLCGKMLAPVRHMPGWMAWAWDDEGEHRLCHGDDDPRPTCYERWVMGERPGVKG